METDDFELDHRHISEVLGSEIDMCRYCGKVMRAVFTPFGRVIVRCNNKDCRPPEPMQSKGLMRSKEPQS